MKTFINMLNEDKGGKNLHLEHLEDEIIMEYLDENMDNIEELNLEDIDYE